MVVTPHHNMMVINRSNKSVPFGLMFITLLTENDFWVVPFGRGEENRPAAVVRGCRRLSS